MNRRLVVIGLAALAGLAPFHHPADQDASRYCLTHALVHGGIRVDGCIGNSVDRSRHGGHLYSNKAPGLSVAAVPAYLVADAFGGVGRSGMPSGRWLWLVRLGSSGVAFVAAALLLLRLGDTFVRGAGPGTAVAFALGTPALAFAASAYDHVPATALLLAAFAAAWRRAPAAAGAAAGLAVLVEYQSAAALLLLLGYVALSGGRSAARFAAASLPGLAAVGAYDWAAFGSPWGNPLSYSDNQYEQAQRTGLLGIHVPSLHGAYLVLLGEKGLLVTSPLLLAAAAGVFLMWRHHRREALLIALVALAYLVAEAGYFDPYAGFSPGPRYAIPGLAFLALGLPYAFERWPLATWLLTGISAVASVAVALTWALGSNDYRGTIWRQLWHVVTRQGHASLADLVAPTVLPVPHAGLADVLLVAGAAATALAVAARQRVPSAASQVAGTPRRRKFQRATTVAPETSA